MDQEEKLHEAEFMLDGMRKHLRKVHKRCTVAKEQINYLVVNELTTDGDEEIAMTKLQKDLDNVIKAINKKFDLLEKFEEKIAVAHTFKSVETMNDVEDASELAMKTMEDVTGVNEKIESSVKDMNMLERI